jgi:ABC-type antimicrobial peptide transport system permease subunit
VYLPFFQGSPRFSPTYEIKFAGNAADTLRAAGDVVAAVNPGLALFRTKTLDQQTEESFARERLLALLTTYFGSFAWLLAGIGLYGLMACTVTERTRECGLRMALGARPLEMCWSVMREGASTVMIGLAVGTLSAIAVVRLVRALLFNVDEMDPTALAGAVAALLLLMCAASFVPARRAARVDPMTALRLE